MYYFGLPTPFFYQVIRPGHILSRCSVDGGPTAGRLSHYPGITPGKRVVITISIIGKRYASGYRPGCVC